MSARLCFVQRRDPETTSIERVFRNISSLLSEQGFLPSTQLLRFGNRFFGMLANLVIFRRSDSDLYHITGQAHYVVFRLPRNRTILTIHDLGILNSRYGIRRYLIKILLFKLPVARARYVTVISEFVKRELLNVTKCEPSKIKVIDNPLTVDAAPHERRFDQGRPVLLLIGTAANKNIERVMNAVSQLPCQLRIIGPLSNDQLSLLQRLEISFENRIGVPDDELYKEFAAADVVVFCSTYEGFGLPIIEAQALSVPLITSDLSPMRDTAGDGAIFVDPYDADDIRRAIVRLTGESELRRRIVSAGRENIRRFEREKIAACYGDLYRTVLDNLEPNIEV